MLTEVGGYVGGCVYEPMESENKHNDLALTQAAHWYARLRAPDCSEADRRSFQHWLSLDDANVRAYADAERMADKITEKVHSDPRLRALAAEALKPSVPASGSYGKWRAAAGILLGLTVSAFAVVRFMAPEEAAASVANFSNTLAQQQRIELQDGSVVNLDIGSEMNVQMSKAERRVELLRGRAYFEVKHDSARPFSVSAGGVRAVDLGTLFQVALEEKSVSVTLAEGSVAVADTTDRADWREVLTPGEQLRYAAETGVKEKNKVDPAVVTSWSSGRLVFKETPLAEALKEVNRYAATKVHLGDINLATVPIGGNFVAGGDSEQFVDALAAVIPLRSVRVGAGEIVLFQRYEKEVP